MKATGESAVVKNYSFSDFTPWSGSNYYRLKIIDQDDTSEYSKIVGANYAPLESLVVFPNPATDKIFVESEQAFTVKKVELYDTVGKLVSSKEMENERDFLEVKDYYGLFVVKIIGDDGAAETRTVLIE